MHLVRERQSSGLIKIHKIESANNVADLFTKSLSAKHIEFFCKKLGLLNLYQAKFVGDVKMYLVQAWVG